MAVPNLWRTKNERYSLQGQICAECSQAVFPPRMVCPYCHQPMGVATNEAVDHEFVFAMPLPAGPQLKVAADD